MELETFVEKTLLQICWGISKAKKELGKISSNNISANKIGDGPKQNISFEVSIYVSSSSNSNINGEAKTSYLLEVTGLKCDVSGNMENYKKNDLIQKISFQVPYSPSLL